MSPASIVNQLERLERKFTDLSNEIESFLSDAQIRPEHYLSALNLLQYLTLRSKNISHLQDALHEKGLSSLASSESHIHRQVQEILMRLGKDLSPAQLNVCTASKARTVLNKNAANLFGTRQPENSIVVMVTLDSELHLNKHAIKGLLKRGMQVARINCAHDNAEIWRKLIELVKWGEKQTGIPCKIYMDLAGPKFRINVCQHGREINKLQLGVGDKVLLTESADIGSFQGKTLYCQIQGIARLLQKGNIVMIDDGLIEAIVTGSGMSGTELTITRISGKATLKSGKGINFPNTPIPIESLTKDDIKSLQFVRKHADMVGYSFVRNVEDLENLHTHLYQDANETTPGLIIKVETPESVRNLPYLLLFAMRYPRFGVMIARGDLAVEIGFERMSEIQEEILWICEAAHTPVIWATQVLEQLNKTGMASRSEITDAYKAAQAECVMINKGRYTHLVLDTLIDIARRSHRHHLKKRYEMQALSIAKEFSIKNL